MYFARNAVARLFTNDSQVIAMFGDVVPFVSLVMLFDGLQIAGAGALRGLGRQSLGMIFNFVAFYLVGIPLGAVLVFVAKIDLKGLWIGLAASDSFSAVLFTICLLCVNWTKASNKIASEEEEAAAKKVAEESARSVGAVASKPAGSYRSLMGKESGVNEFAATRIAAASVSSVRSLRHTKFVPEKLSDSSDEESSEDELDSEEPLDITAIND